MKSRIVRFFAGVVVAFLINTLFLQKASFGICLIVDVLVCMVVYSIMGYKKGDK